MKQSVDVELGGLDVFVSHLAFREFILCPTDMRCNRLATCRAVSPGCT